MRKSFSLTLLLWASLALFSCATETVSSSSSNSLEWPWGSAHPGTAKQLRSTTYAFDTMVSINTYHEETAVHDEIITLYRQLDALLDPYTVPSAGVNSVYTLNHSSEPVVVDPLLFEALERASEAYELTDGMFNPLIGKVTRLYKDAFYTTGVTPHLPDMDLVQNYLKEAGSAEISMNEDTYEVQIVGDAHIDLGGIAKGYALDKTIEILKKYNVADFMIALSGSSIGLGNNPLRENSCFNLGIDTEDEGPDVLIRDRFHGYSTSSIFEQLVTIDGQEYSHMVDPRTGSAQSNNQLAVARGPIDSNAILDALSTTACLLEPGEIPDLEASLLEKGYDVQFLVMDDFEMVYQNSFYDGCVS